MSPTLFQHPSENLTVRTVKHNDEDWFIVRDIAESLGIDTTNVNKFIEKLDEDERNQIPVIDSMGRAQKTHIVNESGLYALILRSDKPAARIFRKWVTSEVLPTLRREGLFSLAGRVPVEDLRVQRLELRLRAAKHRAQAAYLELKGSLLGELPGAVPVIDWIATHKPEVTGRAIGNLVRFIRRAAVIAKRPIGTAFIKNGKGRNHVLTMLPSDISTIVETHPWNTKS